MSRFFSSLSIRGASRGFCRVAHPAVATATVTAAPRLAGRPLGRAWAVDYAFFKRTSLAALSTLASSQRRSQHTYAIRFGTGDMRNAEVKGEITVTLEGAYRSHPMVFQTDDADLFSVKYYRSNRMSRQQLLGDAKAFERATVTSMVVAVPNNLGTVRSITVGHTGSGDGPGWFLEEVTVKHIETGSIWHYRFNAWLGNAPIDIKEARSGPLFRKVFAKPLRGLHLDYLYPRAVPVLPPLRLLASGNALPHIDKVKDGYKGVCRPYSGHAGEDAYLIYNGATRRKQEAALTAAATTTNPTTTDNNDNNDNNNSSVSMHHSPKADGFVFDQYCIGVADGVFAWRDKGIDSGLFSRGLLQGVNDYCSSRPLNLPIDCVKALQAGQDLVAKENILGSATICMVSLNSKTRVLQAANIGDSGFIVIRLEKNPETSVLEPSIVFRSPPQEHVFGCPFQLGHHDKADKVSNAQSSLVDILPGDCVIVGTDGLFDNLFDEQIADIVCKHIIEAKGKVNLALVTKVLRKVLADAFGASMVKRGMMTPYSEAAMNEFNLVFSGGKKDDITAVVGFVQEIDYDDK